ncbi:NAD(P)/FAD-dependent oxidoreductase [Tamlana haliotis]|uniref:NAD(P)/FAD-dependent oxidoreductase n=1 Tax=Pseudotamlana haliotis TaxID=2614804 RepID=A0A6N6MBH6_9FLAO|nr:NAD(P)/FAD-dependent oxidoreductase [Tamlana haliotis]KAB1067928.1 NAD(P)/FAD-dependent oxidoreductase [Tamlana haliotis]
MINKDVIMVGGGAAGFFAAINIAAQNPELKVAILERAKEGLAKVKVSGGGRCNVTHAEFVPSELVQNYPRGEKELLGPFHQFMTGDTIAWFEERGVALKIEDDGRIFPVSNSSQTIIDCFLNEAEKHHVDIYYNHPVKTIEAENEQFIINTSEGFFSAKKIMIATGSNPKIWKLLEGLGHSVSQPVPSLFTFNIKDDRLQDIPGVVALDVEVRVLGTDLLSEGPLLVTHWGLSAPSILKLSAFGALELAKREYKFQIEVNFIKRSFDDCLEFLKSLKQGFAKKTVFKSTQFDLPKRLWHKLVLASQMTETTRWADLNKSQLEELASQLTTAVFDVDGKSTFKEEFVTAGGVNLKEVNFKTFESKLVKNLYFAGEVLNIDAITGGFNFQNAWTGAFIAAQHLSK